MGKLVAKGAKVDGDALVTAMSAEEEKRAALLDVLLAGTVDRSATLRAVSYAADTHDAASIKKIAAKGVAWTALDPHATPPLMNAIVGSDVAMVKALLDAGAPTDRMGEDGDTALLTAVAAAAGDSDEAVRVVRVLLEHGANPNKRGRDGRTALFAAAQQGSEVARRASRQQGRAHRRRRRRHDPDRGRRRTRSRRRGEAPEGPRREAEEGRRGVSDG